MTPSERSTILRLLGESSKALEGSLAGVSKDDAARKPASGGWSVAEVAEHVAIAEEQMFFALTERFRPIPESAPDQQKEAWLLEMTLNRSEKMTSPDVTRPSARFPTMADALAHFRASRARTIHYVENCPDNLRSRSVKHPFAGIVTGYGYLLILASHPARHASQIRAVRSELGF